MSVTVADLMKLPCLREAKVVGGQGGLQRTVSSISVLEYSFANSLQDTLFHHIDFYGNEIVISAFANAQDSVETQLANIQQMADVGEVGLILYYVGIILPCVDQRLIDLADSLDFVLIVMPENRMSLRYSEVISEVMEAIIKDQMTQTHFQNEILERVSRLPVYQRSIDTVMRMLSDRVRASFLLSDGGGRLLNTVSWPRTLELDTNLLLSQEKSVRRILMRGQNFGIDRYELKAGGDARLELLILKQDEALTDDTVRQIGEVLQISINLWSQSHGQDLLPELVRAILQDESFKMRRIADVFRVDVASIRNMWLLTPLREPGQPMEARDRDEREILKLARMELAHLCKTVVADVYDQNVVVFMDDPPTRGDIYAAAHSLCEALEQAGIEALLTVCMGLSNTTEVRNAYLLNLEAIGTACGIYPHRRLFTYHEIRFANECRLLLQKGEEVVRERMSVLDVLRSDEGQGRLDLCETLAAYMLDADSSIAVTAEKMFLHKNTIKYRLARIHDRLAFDVNKLPETMGLYVALALWRLLLRKEK